MFKLSWRQISFLFYVVKSFSNRSDVGNIGWLLYSHPDFLDNCNVCPVSDTVAVLIFVFLASLLETGSLYKVDETVVLHYSKVLDRVKTSSLIVCSLSDECL